MAWLVSEFDHRDPKNDLTDIDTGKYLQALSTLPNSIRQMMEDSDMHVELELIDGQYRIVHIVKRRNAEYLQGTEHFFIFDKDGKRMSLTEDQYNDLLGLKKNPLDVLNTSEVELSSLDSENSPPMDAWDVIFSAKEYLNNLWKLSANATEEEVQKLQDESIYSADWFPCNRDKRLRSKKALELVALIQKGRVTQFELARTLAELTRNPLQEKQDRALQMRQVALQMPLGKERAVLLKRAGDLLQEVFRAPNIQAKISNGEKNRLWEIWRDQQAIQRKTIKLKDWQVKQARVRSQLAKLIREGVITLQDAERQAFVLGRSNKEPVIRRESNELPQWLLDAKTVVEETPAVIESDESVDAGWLFDQQAPSYSDEEFTEETEVNTYESY